MNKRRCAYCGAGMVTLRTDAKFCTRKCGVYHRRKLAKIPVELTSKPRWVRHSDAKVPLTVVGRPAKSTDPSTWSTFKEAQASGIGAGLGFVLNGDGIGCVDLDHVINERGEVDPRAVVLIQSLESFYVEVSPSGTGIHAWVYGGSPDGRKKYTQPDGLCVEWYTDARYITITGRRYAA